MCRIAGMLHAGMPVLQIEQVVRQMCDIQQHGGPDDEGLFTSAENHLVLGNRRLALIDLSQEGHMPMEYRQRYFITYNGELYNYQALRSELTGLGHRFSNHTDTEVILVSFAQWGPQAFSRLQGMFAFALFDSHDKELYIVRDAVGIKPLYFSQQDRSIVFASEIRAFRAVESCRESNPHWQVYMMAYGHLPEPVSTLKNVHPLPKGSYLKYNTVRHSCSLQSFKHYSYSHRLTGKQQVKEEVASLLDKAVKRHLVADAPLGVFLSGGLDSSILAVLAARYKKHDLNTLSIHFNESEFSEKRYQDLVIQQIGCQSHQYLLREDEFHHSFPGILQAMDMPSSDGINTWFISKYAGKQGLKAVLSGVGGDELFGGYPSFRRIQPARLIQQLPSPMIRLGRRSRFKKLNRMSYLRMDGIKGLYLFLRGHFSPYEIARQLDMKEKQVWAILQEHPVLMNAGDVLETSNQASWMEFNLYMQNQLLRDSDVMSMIHGVEIRVPFLDDDLIRMALRIDPAVKYEGARPKQILIDAFQHELPEQVWNRPKMGFSFPFSQWLGSSQYVRDLMMQGGKNSQTNYQKFLKGKLHWSHLMSLVIMRNKGLQ